MKEFTIKENEAGQRLDKYLNKLLKEASTGFLYKMLRKKNIVLNGKKATGSEKLAAGDLVKIFLADDTFEKFAGKTAPVVRTKASLEVIYEDEHVLLINKPAGMLSQKAKPEDVSACEHIVSYLLDTKSLTDADLRTFRPSAANRLDRNTSGLLCAGKTLQGLQYLSELFRDRTLEKYYLALVEGQAMKPLHLKGFLVKDEKKNQVKIYSDRSEIPAEANIQNIETEYVPLSYGERVSLLCVHLITGKTHQIRAHLASIGHPLIGDPKYGSGKSSHFHADRQMLHAWKLRILDGAGAEICPEEAEILKGRIFTAPLPHDMKKLLKKEMNLTEEDLTWEPGTPED